MLAAASHEILSPSLPVTEGMLAMKPPFLLLSAAAVLAFAAGCGPEADADPAFPQNAVEQPIGYDNPSSQPPPPPQQAMPPQPGPDMEVGENGPNDVYEDNDPSALTDFKGTLDPYGQWVDDSQYGTVWVPSESVVGDDFAPYVSAGHWAYGDDYTWVSDYSWGWAPFHYGRWTYIGGRGWGWIPGRRYAGAWVSWRVGGEGYPYVGWAPLAPSYYWRGGAAYSLGFAPTHAYGFCPTGALFSPSLTGHMVSGPQLGAVAGGTRNYVPAHPGVGGVGGPTPMSLHIPANAVVAPPANHAGLAQARNFAHPSTAVAMGGHAPAGREGAVAHGSTGTSGYHGYGGSTYGSYGHGYGSYGSYGHSYGGGYYGGSHTIPGHGYYGGTPRYSSPYSSRNPVFRAPGSGAHAPAPSYHPPASTAHPSGGSRGGSRGGGGRRR